MRVWQNLRTLCTQTYRYVRGTSTSSETKKIPSPLPLSSSSSSLSERDIQDLTSSTSSTPCGFTQEDQDLLLRLATDPTAMDQITDAQAKDPAFMKAAVEACPLTWQKAAPALQTDPSFMLPLILEDPSILSKADQALLCNEDFFSQVPSSTYVKNVPHDVLYNLFLKELSPNPSPLLKYLLRAPPEDLANFFETLGPPKQETLAAALAANTLFIETLTRNDPHLLITLSPALLNLLLMQDLQKNSPPAFTIALLSQAEYALKLLLERIPSPGKEKLAQQIADQPAVMNELAERYPQAASALTSQYRPAWFSRTLSQGTLSWQIAFCHTLVSKDPLLFGKYQSLLEAAPGVLATLLQQHPSLFSSLSPSLQKDKAFILTLLKQCRTPQEASFLTYLPQFLKENPPFFKEAIRINPLALAHAPAILYHDSGYLISILKTDPSLFFNISLTQIPNTTLRCEIALQLLLLAPDYCKAKIVENSQFGKELKGALANPSVILRHLVTHPENTSALIAFLAYVNLDPVLSEGTAEQVQQLTRLFRDYAQQMIDHRLIPSYIEQKINSQLLQTPRLIRPLLFKDPYLLELVPALCNDVPTLIDLATRDPAALIGLFEKLPSYLQKEPAFMLPLFLHDPSLLLQPKVLWPDPNTMTRLAQERPSAMLAIFRQKDCLTQEQQHQLERCQQQPAFMLPLFLHDPSLLLQPQVLWPDPRALTDLAQKNPSKMLTVVRSKPQLTTAQQTTLTRLERQPDFMRPLLLKDPSLLHQALPEILQDPVLMRTMAEKSPQEILKMPASRIAQSLVNDPLFMRPLVLHDPQLLIDADTVVWNDKETMMALARKHPELMIELLNRATQLTAEQKASLKKMQKDASFMLPLVCENINLLPSVDPVLLQPDFLRQVILRSSRKHPLSDKTLQLLGQSPHALRAIAQINPKWILDNMQSISPKSQRDPELWAHLLRQEHHHVLVIDPPLIERLEFQRFLSDEKAISLFLREVPGFAESLSHLEGFQGPQEKLKKQWLKDAEFLNRVLKSTDRPSSRLFFSHVDHSLKSDPSFIIELIRTYPDLLQHAHPNCFSNRTLISQIEKNPSLIQWLPLAQKNDAQFLKKLMKKPALAREIIKDPLCLTLLSLSINPKPAVKQALLQYLLSSPTSLSQCSNQETDQVKLVLVALSEAKDTQAFITLKRQWPDLMSKIEKTPDFNALLRK